MKTITTWTVALVALATLAFAGVPQTINYQGYLKNTSTGAPAGGTVSMTFSLYSSATPRNNPVWVEPAKPVTVTNGIYSTTVGSAANPITAPFDVPYYLGITVNGTELPVQLLSSVPYAQRAAVADSVPASAIANGTLTGAMLAGGTISTDKLAPGVVPSWQNITTATTAVANTGYVTSGATPVSISLPANPAVGDLFSVTGTGSGGWTLATSGAAIIQAGSSAASLIPAGANWSAQENNRSWRSIASSADGSKLVAVADLGQIYTSVDSGASWTARASDGPWMAVASSSDGTKLVAGGANSYIYTSSNSGVTWDFQIGSGGKFWWSLASSSDGTKLVASVSGTGQLHTSTDSGVNWTLQPASVTANWRGVASSSDGSKLLAAAYGGRLYTSTDSGVNWTARETNRQWWSVASSSDGSKLVAVVQGSGYIYTSVDSGLTWTEQIGSGARDWYSVASSSDGSKLLAGDLNGKLYISTDSGATWLPHNVNGQWWAVASSCDGTKLVAADMFGKIHTSASGQGIAIPAGATWSAQENNRSWRSIASSADGSKLVAVADLGQIYTSVDSGASWTARASNGPWMAVASSSDGTKLVAGGANSYIYTSSNSGATWDFQIGSGGKFWWSLASSSDGTKLVASVSGAGQLHTSTDSGVSWTLQPASVTANWRGVASSSDGSKLLAAAYGGRLYTSTDSGVNWTARETNRQWWSVASSSDGSKLVAVVQGGGYIYTSVNSGLTWTEQAGSGARDWYSVASSSDGSKLLAGDLNGKLYISTDSGATWLPHNVNGQWWAVASSSDGTKLAAADMFGKIHTSAAAGSTRSTVISGVQGSSLQIQYAGNNQYQPVSYLPAYAPAQIATGTADGSITTVKLADGAVNDAKLAGPVSAAKLDLSTVVAKAGDTMTGALNLPSNGLIAGTNQLVISGGNVGIGTAAPSQKLEVAGNVVVSGLLTTSGVVSGGTNSSVILTPNGTGTVDVSGKRVSSVAVPTASSDAATKGYVDVFTSKFAVTSGSIISDGKTYDMCILGTVVLTASDYGVPGLYCDGRLLAIASNTSLFSLIGTKFGGDGISTFAIPDLRSIAPNGMNYVICDQGIFPSPR